MDGRVSVNDDSDSPWEASSGAGQASWPAGAEPLPGELAGAAPADADMPDMAGAAEPPEFAESLEPPPGVSYGPCLYLGRSGERCSRPALRGGYCARHHPDAEARWPTRQFARVMVAGIALLLILLPYFEDAVQFVLRILRELRAN